MSCQVHRLANALVEQGQEVTCYSFSPPPADALYRHIKLDFRSDNTFIKKLIPAIMFRMMKTHSYDILHYHGDDFLCAGGPRRIRTFYGSALWEARFAGRWKRFFYQIVFYMFEWCSCLRRGACIGISQVTTKALPMVRTVIPCGVPLERYKPGAQKTADPSLLFIGDLDSRKRGRLLVETFKRGIHPLFPGATLTVIGPQKEIDGKGVRFAGQLDEDALVAEYQRSWIYCSVSSYEGFGVPLIEAMACAAAVVAVDTTGAREIITDGYNGLLCAESALINALVRLISEESLRNLYTANGLRTVKKYDMKIIAERYRALYQSHCYRHHEK